MARATRRSWNQILRYAGILMLAGTGCWHSDCRNLTPADIFGPPAPPPGPTPPVVFFYGWSSLTVAECRGRLGNDGRGIVATNPRIELWYCGVAGDSVVTVAALNDTILPGFKVEFAAPPEGSGGRIRYPRAGNVSWDGGANSWVLNPPMVKFSGWQDGAADSATGYVNNGGGGPFVVSDTAYSVVVTTNTRSGVRDNPTVPADVPDHSFAVFRSDWWDSSGVLMKPQILRITWRDRCDRTLIESCINNVLRQT